jgi:hypothetical protein
MRQIQLQRLEKLDNNKYFLILSSYWNNIEIQISEIEARKLIREFNMKTRAYKDKTIYE